MLMNISFPTKFASHNKEPFHYSKSGNLSLKYVQALIPSIDPPQ